MSKVLIVAEHLDGKLNSATARCVACAKAFNADSIDVVVLSDAPDAVASEAAKIAGVGKVLAVANPANAHALAQVLAPQVAALAAGYTHVLGPSTTFGKDLMPCVAALLGVAQVSDIMAVALASLLDIMFLSIIASLPLPLAPPLATLFTHSVICEGLKSITSL